MITSVDVRSIDYLPILTLLGAAPTFDIAAGTAQVLTSGTCQFFIENIGQNDIEFCWSLFVCLICLSSLFALLGTDRIDTQAQTASDLGTSCLSRGIGTAAACTTVNDTARAWQVLCVQLS